MSTRRAKNVDYDDDDYWEAGGGGGGGDWGCDDWDYDESWSRPQPKAKAAAKAKAPAAKAAGKAAAKASQPKAGYPDAGAPKAATAAAKPKPKATSTSSSAAPPKVEAKEEEVPEESALPEAVDDGRPGLSLVVVGHVDAGKSTLMGHLLCLVGEVSTKTFHKYEKESKQLGKASFAYAWVLDEGDDERQRGVTVDVCVKHFATKSRRFTILDAPGHRDFVPNMLQGAVQADVALLVADVSHFDSGFERGGQTKEHLQLVRALGISHVLVAINKLDTCGWSQTTFEEIKGRLHGFITGSEVGYKDTQVSYVPLSGWTGENMLERKDEALSWWKGPTLIEAMDQLPVPARPSKDLPLRIPVSDLYKSGANVHVSGRVEAGSVSSGQKVIVLPSGEQTTVKSLQSRAQLVRRGNPGDYMDGVVLPVEPQFVTMGGIISDLQRPPTVTDSFQAQILVFDVDIPMMRGQQLMCYLYTETLTATLSRLEKLLVKGQPQDKRPKCLQKGNVAIVNLRVDHKVCVDPKPKDGSPATSLARLVLRDRGQTVAAGMVVDVLPATS